MHNPTIRNRCDKFIFVCQIIDFRCYLFNGAVVIFFFIRSKCLYMRIRSDNKNHRHMSKRAGIITRRTFRT